MFACNQCTKLAQLNVLIRVSSPIQHTVRLCWRDHVLFVGISPSLSALPHLLHFWPPPLSLSCPFFSQNQLVGRCCNTYTCARICMCSVCVACYVVVGAVKKKRCYRIRISVSKCFCIIIRLGYLERLYKSNYAVTLSEMEHVCMQPVYQACTIECAHPHELVSKIYCMAQTLLVLGGMMS